MNNYHSRPLITRWKHRIPKSSNFTPSLCNMFNELQSRTRLPCLMCPPKNHGISTSQTQTWLQMFEVLKNTVTKLRQNTMTEFDLYDYKTDESNYFPGLNYIVLQMIVEISIHRLSNASCFKTYKRNPCNKASISTNFGTFTDIESKECKMK